MPIRFKYQAAAVPPSSNRITRNFGQNLVQQQNQQKYLGAERGKERLFSLGQQNLRNQFQLGRDQNANFQGALDDIATQAQGLLENNRIPPELTPEVRRLLEGRRAVLGSGYNQTQQQEYLKGFNAQLNGILSQVPPDYNSRDRQLREFLGPAYDQYKDQPWVPDGRGGFTIPNIPQPEQQQSQKPIATRDKFVGEDGEISKLGQTWYDKAENEIGYDNNGDRLPNVTSGQIWDKAVELYEERMGGLRQGPGAAAGGATDPRIEDSLARPQEQRPDDVVGQLSVARTDGRPVYLLRDGSRRLGEPRQVPDDPSRYLEQAQGGREYVYDQGNPEVGSNRTGGMSTARRNDWEEYFQSPPTYRPDDATGEPQRIAAQEEAYRQQQLQTNRAQYEQSQQAPRAAYAQQAGVQDQKIGAMESATNWQRRNPGQPFNSTQVQYLRDSGVSDQQIQAMNTSGVGYIQGSVGPTQAQESQAYDQAAQARREANPYSGQPTDPSGPYAQGSQLTSPPPAPVVSGKKIEEDRIARHAKERKQDYAPYRAREAEKMAGYKAAQDEGYNKSYMEWQREQWYKAHPDAKLRGEQMGQPVVRTDAVRKARSNSKAYARKQKYRTRNQPPATQAQAPPATPPAQPPVQPPAGPSAIDGLGARAGQYALGKLREAGTGQAPPVPAAQGQAPTAPATQAGSGAQGQQPHARDRYMKQSVSTPDFKKLMSTADDANKAAISKVQELVKKWDPKYGHSPSIVNALYVVVSPEASDEERLDAVDYLKSTGIDLDKMTWSEQMPEAVPITSENARQMI
jgi:hypothetical protein